MGSRIRSMPARVAALALLLFVAPLAATPQTACSISTTFNGTKIAADRVIWFSAAFTFNGLNSPNPPTMRFSGSTIRFTSGTAAFNLPVPNAQITFDPHAVVAATSYDSQNKQWVTVLPASGWTGDAFLTALPFHVPKGGLPGGVGPVTWQGAFSFTTGAAGSQVQWHWAAVVYRKFPTNLAKLTVKPVANDFLSPFHNGDNAGSPENETKFVVAGATGAGGTDYTGAYTDYIACTSGGFVPPQISSCKPTSSLGALVSGTSVTAYVPNGSWSTTTTGVRVVPVEPTGTPAAIATPAPVNSCAANSTTGEAVCTANNTDVYLLTGATLTNTLTSGATGSTGFSGGSCQNCGVAINEVTNTAVIAMGLSSAPSRSGLQFLDLAKNSFAPPVPASNEVSEDILWDPGRNLILSPDEAGVYDLFDTSASTTPEYAQPVGGVLDSAAEDCTTGIALASDEFTGNVFFADLTQAKLSAGSPGTWTAPEQFVTFPEFTSFAAGTDGIAVAPGSHLAIVTGEFGGNQIGVVELPAASGSGTPGPVDYAAAALPNTPDGQVWAEGLDPHTVTAYIDPVSSAPTALLANQPPPTWLAVVNLQALLAAPRLSGSHNVDPSFDLVKNGVVTYVSTGSGG